MATKKTTKKAATKSAVLRAKPITSINQIVKEERVFEVDWSKVPTGTKVKGRFGGISFDGRFLKYPGVGYGYICSNTLNGNSTPNKLGYKYSHTISKYYADRFRITELTLDPKFKMPELFTINGHIVQFNKDSIKIGCTSVSNTVVKKIAAKLV